MRMAVIGCGPMGVRHAQKLARMADVDLIGVCDTNEYRADKLAGEVGCDPVQEYWDLNGEIDAAVVATNPGTHGEICYHLMGEGIHVLVEKPMATTEKGAADMQLAAETNGVVLQVGHVERFNPVFNRISQVAGIPFQVEVERHSPVAFQAVEVDVVLDLMIHDIDLILSLAKTEVSRITGSGTRDSAIAELRFVDGSVAVLRANRKAKTRSRVWTVNEDKHYLIGEHDAIHDELRHFIDCIRKGEQPVVSGREGAAALKVALEVSRQIRESE